MKKQTLAFVVVLALGIAGLLGYYVYNNLVTAETQITSSDAADIKQTLHIGMDSWVGYFPLCSPNLKRRMRSTGVLVRCHDDSANLDERMRKLKKGQLQFAVSTVDAYLTTGKDHNYPGTIVAVVDESKGGDAILVRSDKISSLDDLKIRPVKVALTKDSPSDFFLQAVAVHFDLDRFKQRGKWLVPADGADASLKALQSGKADVAVLWEPAVSRGLKSSKIKKLLSTADTQRLVVDVLLVQREFLLEQEETVKLLLANYYRTLKYYRSHEEKLVSDLATATSLSHKEVRTMLQGVDWQTLYDNDRTWYGIGPQSREDLPSTIDAVMAILQETRTLQDNPLPDGNPYSIQNKTIIHTLHRQGLSDNDGDDRVGRKFAQLSAKSWDKLKPVGTLRVRPINFQSGSHQLTSEGEQEMAKIVRNLSHYPNFRIVIKGHTGLRGDAKANRKLSLARAEAVKNYLVEKHGLAQTRMRALGLGSDEPLPRRDGESQRSYQYRLPRVELYLVTEVY